MNRPSLVSAVRFSLCEIESTRLQVYAKRRYNSVGGGRLSDLEQPIFSVLSAVFNSDQRSASHLSLFFL